MQGLKKGVKLHVGRFLQIKIDTHPTSEKSNRERSPPVSVSLSVLVSCNTLFPDLMPADFDATLRCITCLDRLQLALRPCTSHLPLKENTKPPAPRSLTTARPTSFTRTKFIPASKVKSNLITYHSSFIPLTCIVISKFKKLIIYNYYSLLIDSMLLLKQML